MAHALAWNLNRGQRNVRLFEIGRAYTNEGYGAAAVRTRIVTIGATGVVARSKGVAETPGASTNSRTSKATSIRLAS